MSESGKKKEKKVKTEQQPFRVCLPGFIIEDELGLGDLVKTMTSGIGIKPCGGCQQRAAAMNRMITFSGKQHK